MQECLGEIRTAANSNDQKKISYFAHRISGSASSFGHFELAKKAKAIEIEIAQGNSASSQMIAELTETGATLINVLRHSEE